MAQTQAEMGGAMDAAATANSTLRARTITASAWVAGGSVLANVVRLLANLVVTRLLFPEAFGLMLMANTVLFIVAMLSDVGIHQSIVRGNRGEDPLFLDTAWTLKIVRGVLIWSGTLCIALMLHVAQNRGWLPVDSTYANAALPLVLAVSTFTAVITGFAATDVSSASRRLLMKPVVLLELGTQVFSILLMVALAWWWRSVWALIVSGLVGATLQTLLSHRMFGIHRNRFRFDQGAFKEMLSFGKWIAMSSAATAFASNGDRIVLAGLVSAEVLGKFSVAIALAGVLDIVVQTVFSRVMMPALSEVARTNPARLPAAFFKLRRRIDPLLMLVAGALFALGPTIVELLYDERYIDAGNMLQVLSLGLVVARLSVVQQVYLALNQPRYLAVINVVRLLSVYLMVPLAFSHFGLLGALVAIALRDVPTVPFVLFFNARHGLNNIRLEALWLAIWPLGYVAGIAAVRLHDHLLAHA